MEQRYILSCILAIEFWLLWQLSPPTPDPVPHQQERLLCQTWAWSLVWCGEVGVTP